MKEDRAYCMVPTIQHPGKGKSMANLKRSAAARSLGWEEEGMNRWSTNFYGTYIKDLHGFVILQWWIHVITFFQVLNICTPRRILM